MSLNETCETGAEASNESTPRDTVAGLMSLSPEEKSYLDSYSMETCQKKIEELISYIDNLAGKPTRTRADVLGQLTMLYQRERELQDKENSKLQLENSQLQLEKSQLQLESSQLQLENTQLQRESSQLLQGVSQLQQEKRGLTAPAPAQAV